MNHLVAEEVLTVIAISTAGIASKVTPAVTYQSYARQLTAVALKRPDGLTGVTLSSKKESWDEMCVLVGLLPVVNGKNVCLFVTVVNFTSINCSLLLGVTCGTAVRTNQ